MVGIINFNKPARHGLRMLLEALNLSSRSLEPSNLCDVVVVSIDSENINTIMSGFSRMENCQVGLAILDTKDLLQISPSKLISTYNFATGSSAFLSKVSNKFLFGESVNISQLDISSSIESLFPKNRNILFVCHEFRSDLQVLRALDFPFPERLSGILDIFNMVDEVLEFWAGFLGDIVIMLGCPCNGLHCAGNDAHFTLRALLLLAARGFNQHQQQSIGSEHDKILDTSRRIATHPIPYRLDPEIEQ